MKSKTVLVLGAGFTRAFLPSAPLLLDKYDLPALRAQTRSLPYAYRILMQEAKRAGKGRLDLERLMTRLDGGMPYDSVRNAQPELAVLLDALLQDFLGRIDRAKTRPGHLDELSALAEVCVSRGITCVTFNYDDVFDQALWEVFKNLGVINQPYWHPDGGYGFFCKPSEISIRDVVLQKDQTAMYLLKLHGSINWRPRLGSHRPYPVDAILHHEHWYDWFASRTGAVNEAIELHLEPGPFIVPPILAKSSLMQEPILRLVWGLAYKEIARADRVIFLGYSFPDTDLAARFLFGEAIKPKSEVLVVNSAKSPSAMREIKGRYRNVLPAIPDGRFYFRGALAWSQEFCRHAAAVSV